MGRTLAILKDIVEAVSGEATKSKTIVYKSVQESLHTTLTLFPVYIHESGRNMHGVISTARAAPVAASLLQACYLAVIKPVSGCVRIACSGLMITRLLQVVNRLDAS